MIKNPAVESKLIQMEIDMKYIFSRQGEWLDNQRKGKGKYFHKDGLIFEVNFHKQGIFSPDLDSGKVVI